MTSKEIKTSSLSINVQNHYFIIIVMKWRFRTLIESEEVKSHYIFFFRSHYILGSKKTCKLASLIFLAPGLLKKQKVFTFNKCPKSPFLSQKYSDRKKKSSLLIEYNIHAFIQKLRCRQGAPQWCYNAVIEQYFF